MTDFKNKKEYGDCVCVRATAKAILVECDELGQKTWVPNSQVDDDSEVYEEGDEGALIVSEYISQKLEWQDM